MTDEQYKFWGIFIPSITVLLGRLWSMWEHRKTGKQITEIKISLNGELDRRISEAREEGRKQGLKETNKSSL